MASFFQKSLHDLIRGIRTHSADEDRYIRTCLDEIRAEVKKTDLDVKAVAIAKLFYLHMLGFDMGWAAFHVVEVMSSHNLVHKRIGYIAAAISFRQDTSVLMLCTNLIKKDLNSNNYLETALALNGLCTIVTPDLGRDLSPDLIAMMNHSRPYIRKRVILCLYKVFLKYPEALRVAVPRLKDRLEDVDPSVVSASVNVVCELARKNPKSYLPLAPQLFTILTTSTNNWLLIKIVKLFGALCPLEPRLIKKLVGPITNLIQTTSAMSLAYECILTAIMGGMIGAEGEGDGHGESGGATLGKKGEESSDSVLTRICVSKLKVFISDSDQNLKYLGLFALCKLLPLRPHAVGEHRDIILDCLEDKDISIRMRALELVSSMVTKRNLMVIVKHLMKQLDPTSIAAADDPIAAAKAVKDGHNQPTSANLTIASDSTYGNQVIRRILEVCSKDTYRLVTDFEWYVGVLIGFVKVKGSCVGVEVAEQLVDVCVRVEGVREVAVALLTDLILDPDFHASTAFEKNNTDVLYAAAWVVGEYSHFVSIPQKLICHLVDTSITNALPATVQSTYIQAALKIYSAWVNGTTSSPKEADLLVLEEEVETDKKKSPMTKQEFQETTTQLLNGLQQLCTSTDLEVQERASTSVQIIGLIQDLTLDDSETEWNVPSTALDLSLLFAGDLKPVNPQAQALVPIPEGLDLDAWIYEPEADLVSVSTVYSDRHGIDFEDVDEGGFFGKKNSVRNDVKPKEEDKRKVDAYYIGNNAPAPAAVVPAAASSLKENGDVEEAPKKKKIIKKVVKKDLFAVPSNPRTQYAINRDDELPIGVTGPQRSHSKRNEELDEDTLNIRSVDLTAPAPATSSVANKLGWEVDRAALLSEETPKLADIGVEVVRKVKKVVKVKKVTPVTSSPIASGSEAPEPVAAVKPKTPVRSDSQISTIISETSNVEVLPSLIDEPLPNISTSTYESMEPESIAALPTFRACVENDDVIFGYDWYSQGLVSVNQVCVTICLVIFNKAPESLKDLSFTIATHPGAQVTALDGSSVLRIQNSDEILSQGFGKVLMNVVLQRNQESGLRSHIIEGASSAVLGDDSNNSRLVPFTIHLPATMNLHPDLRISPATFAECLSNASNFPHSSSIQFPVTDVQEFSEIVKTLAARLRLSVVEEVPLAASIYGKSVGSGENVHVAGLIKARAKAKPTNSMMKVIGSGAASGGGASATTGGGFISVELKSGDLGLIDVLIEEVNEYSGTL